MQRGGRFIGVLLCVLGAAIIGLAVNIQQKMTAFYATAVKAEGRVIGIVETSSGRDRSYAPRVQFADAMGNQHTFVHDISSRPPGYDVGEVVPVAYAPENPSKAKINSKWARLGRVALPGGVGGVFFLVGVLITIRGIGS